MSDHEHLLAMLTRLRLTAVRDQVDTLLDDIARKDLTPRAALIYLCEAEIARKDHRRIAMARKLARFPFDRTMDGFEFDAQPSLDPKRFVELGTCRWVANGDNVLLLGPPGVGKTHLAVGMGRVAIERGYSVLFTSAAQLIANLSKAHDDGRLEEKLTSYGKPKLLIVDELGYLPLERSAAHLFFQLVVRRYEKGSLLLTSNRGVGEWGDVFGDAVLATAILDRLLHHSQVITIRGESYRLREKRRSGLFQVDLSPRPLGAEGTS